MKKILFSTSSFNIDSYEDKKILLANGFSLVTNPFKRRLTEIEIKNLLKDEFVGIIAGLEPLNQNVLSSAKSLRVISRCGIGIDNIDLKSASKNGIEVFNTPDAPSQSVAELTLAHILNLLRHVSYSDRSLRINNWDRKKGFLLSGKTVGIIGLGRIGLKVAKLVSAFGAKVIYRDIKKTNGYMNFKNVSLNILLEESDIISLHIPYNKTTHHIIDIKSLNKMKRSAILVNLSRGGLIDEEALFKVLKHKRIQGAGLDAFFNEPYQGNLLTLENILLTPHIGSLANESRIRMEKEALANLITGLKKSKLI